MPGSMRLTFLLLAAAGCSGRMQYLPPETGPDISTSKVVPASRDAVWQRAVAELGKVYFAINVSDAAGGLLNISFTGDPAEYLDCGRIVSDVKNLAGARSYDFPAATRSQRYEVMDSGRLFSVQRSLALEGRANVVVERLAARSTRISVNAEYVLTRKLTANRTGTDETTERSDRITVTSTSPASFPAAGTDAVACRSTGKLESEILARVQ